MNVINTTAQRKSRIMCFSEHAWIHFRGHEPVHTRHCTPSSHGQAHKRDKRSGRVVEWLGEEGINELS